MQNQLSQRGETTRFIDLEDSRFVQLLNSGVDAFLGYLRDTGIDLTIRNQKIYVFIDEIQYLAKSSPFLKLIIDHHKYLQLIVSGSSSFDIKSKFSDSLVGRTVAFEIFPLSFAEFLRFKGTTIVPHNISSPIVLEEVKSLYREYVRFGGYPKIVREPDIAKKETYLQQIIDTYIRKDIRDLANIRDIDKFNKLLLCLAPQTGQLLKKANIAKLCSLSQETVEDYLTILEQTYIIKRVTPFSRNASVEVVKTPKVFFYDTGLVQMLWLHTIPEIILGNVFETSVFGELVKRYKHTNIHYWRNKNQNEIDFIIRQGLRVIPIEVKEHFQNFHRRSITFFLQKYHVVDYHVVALEGEKSSPHYCYPWEI